VARDTNTQLKDANNTASKAAQNIDRTVDNFRTKVKRANEIVNKECTKLARKMIQKNYASSGLKTKSGKLAKAIQEIECIVTMLSKKPKIIIHMPDSVGDYPKKNGGGNFYAVANALNSGSLRGGKEKNKKRRKSIKKKIQKNSEKKNPKSNLIIQGHVLSGGKQTAAGSTSFSGGTSVTKAYNYWTLTSSQHEQLRNLVVTIFQREVFEKE